MTDIPIRFSQADFDEFARISGDLNPIHVDAEFARATRFGGTVAHGMMLFAVTSAELARLEGPVNIATQELMCTHPTFADRPYVLSLRKPSVGPVEATLQTDDGTTTMQSKSWLGDGAPSTSGASGAETAQRLDRLSLRDTASSTRTFSPGDVDSLVSLVDDPDPRHRGPGATVPPALVGGLISYLLGMQLPGPGTNWLKQRYDFLSEVPPGSPVTGSVEIVRLRPEKQLVDLACRCEVDNDTVMTGRSLVYVGSLRSQIAPPWGRR